MQKQGLFVSAARKEGRNNATGISAALSARISNLRFFFKPSDVGYFTIGWQRLSVALLLNSAGSLGAKHTKLVGKDEQEHLVVQVSLS